MPKHGHPKRKPVVLTGGGSDIAIVEEEPITKKGLGSKAAPSKRKRNPPAKKKAT